MVNMICIDQKTVFFVRHLRKRFQIIQAYSHDLTLGWLIEIEFWEMGEFDSYASCSMDIWATFLMTGYTQPYNFFITQSDY